MDSEWVNVGTDDKPRYQHVHGDGTRHKTDRTIPFLSTEGPRTWRARYICRQCRADLERRWAAEEATLGRSVGTIYPAPNGSPRC